MNIFHKQIVCLGSSAHSRVALDPDPPAEPVGGGDDGGAAAGDADDDDAGAAQHGRHDDHGVADAAAAHPDGDKLVGGERCDHDRHHPRRQESARPADPGRAPSTRICSLLHTQFAKRFECFAGGVARRRREIAVEFGLGDREQWRGCWRVTRMSGDFTT